MKSLPLVLAAFILCIALTSAQTINTEIINEGETPYLLGKINKIGLTSENYKSWFNKNYDEYQPEILIINQLAENLNNYHIKVFLGTWCGDSKREVPKFYKLLDACKFPESQLEVIALSGKADMYKQSPTHEEQGLNIHRVPTFVVYKNGIEINRIIELPVETLEKDLLNIITNNTYIPQYHIVTIVDDHIKTKRFKSSKKRAKTLKPHSKTFSELNTYSYILSTTNRTQEALEVLKMNFLLFPEDARSYTNLAHSYYNLHQPKKALKFYKKALQLTPDDKNIQEYIAALKNNP